MAETVAAKKENPFARFFKKIGGFFVNFGKRFKEGSIGTKLSHFIFGAGNFYHHQWVKGSLYLLFQIAFILFMVLCPEVNGTPYGYRALGPEGILLQGKDGTATKAGSEPTLMLLFGLVTIVAIIAFILLYFSNIKSSFKADQDVKEGRKPTTFKEDLKALLDNKFHILMLTPTCIAAVVFTIIPTIFMICLAFTSYNQVDMNAAVPPTKQFTWVGFENFGAVFTGAGSLGKEISARFLPVLGWTFIWAILATSTCYFGGILLALLINKKGIKLKKLWRTIFILTIALPQFISLLTIRNLLGVNGPINKILMDLGWIKEEINFLGLGTLTKTDFFHVDFLPKLVIILVNMWVGIPYTMLMTSGILMNIPADLYEAGTVDGASKAKMFFKITLPYVVFVTTPYLISSFIGNINSFNTIYLLTGGGPDVKSADMMYTYKAGSSDLLVTWLYKLTIKEQMYNAGAVIGIFTFIITATITLITYRNSKAYKEEDTFQ